MRTYKAVIAVAITALVLTGCEWEVVAGDSPLPTQEAQSPSIPSFAEDLDESTPQPRPTDTVAADDICPRPDSVPEGLSETEALLEALQVCFERPSYPDYDREGQFGRAWPDYEGYGCDERNRILADSMTNVILDEDGCTVLTGTLDDPFTGDIIEFTRGRGTSNAVQIDHVVSLSDAWRSGAYRWTQDERVAFANDFINLVAGDGPENARKGDRTAADYLPPNTDWECEFVTIQVETKAKYDLSVMVDEKQVMLSVLDECA